MRKSIIVSGSGGQGVMSAGITLANAAVDVGKYATYLPEYGPEQRGGSAKCTVILSDSDIISPLQRTCDALIVMNEQSFKKFGNQLSAGGVLILNSSRVTSPVTRTDVKVISMPVDDMAVEIGNVKAANIIMLGALIAATGVITEEEMLISLAKKFAGKKPAIIEMNTLALRKGIEAVNQ